MDKLLRYEIDSWDQVSGCLSNNSKSLKLTCTEIFDQSLTGTVIRVEHERYGCLFAYLVSGSGSILEYMPSGVLHELSTEDVLMELEKFGFIIKLSKKLEVNDDQYSLLITAKQLGMDKIRIMYVDTPPRARYDAYQFTYTRTAYLVCFKSSDLSSWLDNQKVCTAFEFSKAVQTGKSINLTEAQGGLKGNNWSFLFDKVLNLDDILSVAR